jgi:hypothetical protein
MKARGLDGALRKGLQALGTNSKRVTVAKPRKAVHSIALDESLKAQYPNAPRWDYGIGLQENKVERIAWVEVHPATSSEVDAVLKKLAWLKTWLAQHADPCHKTPATFHWVATDAGVYIDTARRRRLNAAGLEMPQSQLRL